MLELSITVIASEAIQSAHEQGLDCFVASLLAMTLFVVKSFRDGFIGRHESAER
jgi:hypothetical protein